MTITIKYECKNFWGIREYREDTINNASLEDLKKAFRFLKKEYMNVIQIDNIVLYWDTMQNFEYGTLTAREYDGNNWKEYSWDFEGCKKSYYEKKKEAA